MPDCDSFFSPLEFAYQTKDAATGAASIIVNNEGMCSAYQNIVTPSSSFLLLQKRSGCVRLCFVFDCVLVLVLLGFL